MNNLSVEYAKKIRDKHNELLKENGLAGKPTLCYNLSGRNRVQILNLDLKSDTWRMTLCC